MEGPLLIAVLAGMLARQAPDAVRGRAAADLSAEVAARLGQEADRVGRAGISPLFATLTDPARSAQLRPTAGQVELARRLEALTGAILRAWLTRDLGATHPPPPAALAERLSEKGVRLRALVVRHAESLAIEGILTREQAQTWRKAAGRRAEPLLAGREKLTTTASPLQTSTAPELIAILRGGAEFAGPPGQAIWWAIHGPRIDRPAKAPAALHASDLDLSKLQADLSGQMTELTLAIYKGWLTRDLGGARPPPQHVLSGRVLDSGPVHASLFAHAEAITLRGILTPDQADRCLLAAWRRAGMEALRDPAIAAWLGLSRSQRDDLDLLLDEKDAVQEDPSWGPGPPMDAGPAGPEGDGATRWYARDRRDFLDGQVWDCLKPAQRRELRRILDGEERPPRRAGARAR